MSRILSVAMAPFLLGVVACGAGSQDPGEGSQGSGGGCAPAFVYRSHIYWAAKAEEPVEPGQPLGEVRSPPCDDADGFQVDSNGKVTEELAPEENASAPYPAFAIAGVDPADAFVVPSRYRGYLFYSGSSDGTADLPPEVRRLLNH